jgi:histidinol dehydrogenase
MRVISVSTDGYKAAAAALRRQILQDNPRVEGIVREIIADVRARGNVALLELGQRFDSPDLEAIEVTNSEWDNACSQVDTATRQALAVAAARITAFHEQQHAPSWQVARDGFVLGQTVRPISRVGVHVPGGPAGYPSSVLMAAIPARVAGVPHIVMCCPCRRDGKPHPTMMLAARLAGVQRVYLAGGAQAIAAMAFGTGTVPAVDKIVGPGNVYVTVAKRLVYGIVDIELLAGPSEVCVVADEGANAVFAAADMLTQAEHGPDSAAYLITPSADFAREVETELDRQMALLPRRDILREALDTQGAIVVSETLAQALELADVCAPEHLALMVRDPFAVLGSVHNAGAVLLGDYAPQTLGDYAAGPSHTLPTSGTARFASPLSVETFLKRSSFIYSAPNALTRLAPTLTQLAESEGFDAHAAAVRARLRGEESGT